MKQDATAEPHTATERRRQLKKESTPVYAVSRNFTLFKAAVKDLDTLLHHLNQHIQCSNVFALIHAQCLSGFVTLNRLNMLVYACICVVPESIGCLRRLATLNYRSSIDTVCTQLAGYYL